MSKRTNTAVWYPDRKRWQINVQMDGKRRTFVSSKPGRTGQREANAKADAWLETGITPTDRRIEDVWAEFIVWRRSISETEYKKVESFGRLYFLPHLGHKKVSSMSEQDLVKLMNTDTTLFRGKWVHDDCINYYRFQVLTGLRPGELCGLRWSDIRDGICTIRRSVNVDGEVTQGKNENALRSFKLIPMAEQVLRDQWKESGHMENIFPMLSMRSYYGHWKRYQQANGMEPPISLYEMRHTFVSATKSLPEGQLRQLVGHSKSMDTYGTYSHILETDADDTAEAVQDIFETLLAADK